MKIVNYGEKTGDHGYFYISYDIARFGAKFENSYETAWVYVPKATNYQPKLMSVIGIHHPIRCETFDGFVVYDKDTYPDTSSSKGGWFGRWNFSEWAPVLHSVHWTF